MNTSRDFRLLGMLSRAALAGLICAAGIYAASAADLPPTKGALDAYVPKLVDSGGPMGPIYAARPPSSPVAGKPSSPSAGLSTLTAAGASAVPPAPNVVRPNTGGFANSGYRSIHYEEHITSGGYVFHLAVDNDTVFVSDITNNYVQMYQIVGGGVTFLRTFGTGPGSAGGQFSGPEQVAVVGNDVFVADFGNDRIQRFNKTTGAYISQFGTSGTGAGQFTNPSGLIYNPVNGFLYVSEVGTNRIQAFTTSGTYQFGFATPGAGNGQLANPYGLSVDTLGYIYVADTGNGRISKFSSTGTWIRHISGLLTNPTSVFVDKSNDVWVPTGTGDIYVYDSAGGYRMYYYGTGGPAAFTDGYFQAIRGIAVTPPLAVAPFNGTPAILVSDPTSQAVSLFSSSAQATTHPLITSIPGFGAYIGGAATDSNENVYLTDTLSNKVYKYDRFGALITSWGTAGSGNGQMSSPQGIAIDDSDVIYVCDRGNNRIQKFSATGTYVGQWGSVGTGDGQFNGPSAIATDGSWIYVTDEGNNRVQKFSFSGGWVRKWGTLGVGNGQFSTPGGITVDRRRQQVYVAEYAGNRIQQFSVFGDFVKVFFDSTSGTGAVANAVGLTTDQHGNVYVADRGNNRVVQFNDNGTYLSNFTSTTANGIFVTPKSNQIYVGGSTGGTLSRYGTPIGKYDTIGIWRPSNQTFYLRNSNTTGFADIIANVQFAQSTDLPIVGDWNGDGIATIGLYRPSTSFFFLWDRNTNVSLSNPDYTVLLGNPGDIPMAGDWNGDGKTSVGVYRPSNGILYLKNGLTTGVAEYYMVLGNASDKGVGGDWNGDGQFSAGVFRPSNNNFYLSDKVSTGVIFGDYAVLLGNPGDTPFVGNWDHSQGTGLGVYRPSTGFLYLKYGLTGPFADVGLFYGSPGDVGLGGVWGPATP
jgi:sugar lactone lactonase YvrE